ncbi:hypothetical protein IR083_03825 [Dysgonomonas sp. GY75]|uniref:hypothetical protein n=1 Tax=Dysgonomonas sp. GY75 TaxID=2780419 RepID=UPI00188437D5|nr:hypothetical protein [Dysgonomonas sp. GY75]MBF0647944.1 hypothetical protein [Dysgonomonas sp. GY75]
MTNFMYLLKQEVEVQLHVLEKEEALLSMTQRAILLLRNVFKRLKKFTGSYVFKDEREEICFFKEASPAFLQIRMIFISSGMRGSLRLVILRWNPCKG